MQSLEGWTEGEGRKGKTSGGDRDEGRRPLVRCTEKLWAGKHLCVYVTYVVDGVSRILGSPGEGVLVGDGAVVKCGKCTMVGGEDDTSETDSRRGCGDKLNRI